MKWNQFRLKTTTEAEDIVSSMLADLGIEGVQIEDKIPLTQSDTEQMFVDILPDIPEDDGCAYLTFYLDEDVDKQELLLKVRQELEEMRSYLNVGECTIEESQTEDVDWVNNWKQYFHQFYIDDILVIPSWENVEAKDSDKMVIHIDPGTAFGTGMHETTQLCIRQLKKYVTEDTEILDVGCGSGILGMLALKFGAKHSVGTDLDPCAIDATYENMDNNGISRDQYEVMIGNIIDDKAVQDKVGYEKYDIVAANILADVLVPLTPVIIHQMKKGGIYITSGIIEDKEDVHAAQFLDPAPLDRIKEQHLVAALTGRLGLRDQARGVIAAAFCGSRAARRCTRIVLRDPQGYRGRAALEVRPHRRGDHRIKIFGRWLDPQEHFTRDHERAQVQRAAVDIGDPVGLLPDDRPHRLDEQVLG